MKMYFICMACLLAGYLMAKVKDFTEETINDDSWER